MEILEENEKILIIAVFLLILPNIFDLNKKIIGVFLLATLTAKHYLPKWCKYWKPRIPIPFYLMLIAPWNIFLLVVINKWGLILFSLILFKLWLSIKMLTNFKYLRQNMSKRKYDKCLMFYILFELKKTNILTLRSLHRELPLSNTWWFLFIHCTKKDIFR